MTDTGKRPFYMDWLWLLPMVVGGVLTVLTVFVFPPDRVVNNLLDFVYKIIPLVSAILAIAWFPNRSPHWGLLLLLGFIFYMGYLDTAFILQVDKLAAAAVEGNVSAAFPGFYTFNLLVNTFTVFLAIFAYRLGGARSTSIIKLGFSAMLVMISGLNDLTMWYLGFEAGQRPAELAWASHIQVFVGRVPTVSDAVIFMLVHFVLVAVILWLPLQRWIDRAHAKGRGWVLPFEPAPSLPAD